MKFDWDADSPQLRANLEKLLKGIIATAAQRKFPSLLMAKAWHGDVMSQLAVPNREYVSAFRGFGALKNVAVSVGSTPSTTGKAAPVYGVMPSKVGVNLNEFHQKLNDALSALDAENEVGTIPSGDSIGAILDVAAWAHSEWVRIHPFVNGNGRIARIWANFVLIRYGLPPVVTLRPRPDGEYASASARAMTGNWEPMSVVFKELLERELASGP